MHGIHTDAGYHSPGCRKRPTALCRIHDWRYISPSTQHLLKQVQDWIHISSCIWYCTTLKMMHTRQYKSRKSIGAPLKKLPLSACRGLIFFEPSWRRSYVLTWFMPTSTRTPRNSLPTSPSTSSSLEVSARFLPTLVCCDLWVYGADELPSPQVAQRALS